MKRRKAFFSEEKNQKTFMSCRRPRRLGHAGAKIKVFLLLFLQKKKALNNCRETLHVDNRIHRSGQHGRPHGGQSCPCRASCARLRPVSGIDRNGQALRHRDCKRHCRHRARGRLRDHHAAGRQACAGGVPGHHCGRAGRHPADRLLHHRCRVCPPGARLGGESRHGVPRCAGFRRYGGCHRRHAHLHGGWRGRCVRPRRDNSCENGPQDRALRRRRGPARLRKSATT